MLLQQFNKHSVSMCVAKQTLSLRRADMRFSNVYLNKMNLPKRVSSYIYKFEIVGFLSKTFANRNAYARI